MEHGDAAHSTNFNKKVHKPHSKLYGRKGAHFLGSEGLQETHMDILNPFISKLTTLNPRGGF